MVVPLVLSASLLFQALTEERARFPDHEVLVAYADENLASAVGSLLAMPDGNVRVDVYTVYRRGTALSGGRTPAYSEETVDFDCGQRRFKLVQSSFFRPNADTIETWNSPPQFTPASDDPMRRHQLETACGTDRRVQYGNYFLFMEAYGLNDGRLPRSPPGPLVP